jgi:acetyl esterase/lipase
VALPAAAVAFSPWTDLALTGESFRANAEADPMLSSGQATVFARLYLAGAEAKNPYASPLYGDVAGLPPSLIQVGGDEILRDDAVRMADKLRAAGCSVEPRDLAAHAACLAIVRASGAGGTTSRRAGRCIRPKADGLLSTVGLDSLVCRFCWARTARRRCR